MFFDTNFLPIGKPLLGSFGEMSFTDIAVYIEILVIEPIIYSYEIKKLKSVIVAYLFLTYHPLLHGSYKCVNIL